MQSSAEHFK